MNIRRFLACLLVGGCFAVLGLRKIGDDVFFITSGAVDDEWGYVITGDASVCMDGLWRLERVGNGVFRFSTRK